MATSDEGPGKIVGISKAQGVAMYTGAILGAGLLIMPSLAAQEAGPASILAWIALLVFSVPVALTFAALGEQSPDAGGIATFVRRAFGGRSAAVVGYWFYFTLPFGAPATAIVGANYIVNAAGISDGWVWVFALALFAAAMAANYAGLQISSGIQLVVAGALAVVIVIACLSSIPRLDGANFSPFMPEGISSVFSAGALLFFTFAGWEAVTHFSHEFRHPEEDLKQVTIITLMLVTILYLALAVVCIAVLGPSLGETRVPLSQLLQPGMGSAAGWVTAALASCLTYGAMTVFLAGASRLGAALARDGALPPILMGGTERGEVPGASLTFIGLLALAVFAIIYFFDWSLAGILLAVSSLSIAVTLAGLLAGYRLFAKGSSNRYGAAVAIAVMAIMLISCGYVLALPAVLAICAYALANRWKAGNDEFSER